MGNDLNLVLKAKVVKLKVQLDIEGSKLPSQVVAITKSLVNNPVKLKVQLNATVAELTAQVKAIKTRAAGMGAVKIKVDLDSKGAGSLKGSLDNVSKTVGAFNRTYAQQAKQMTASKEKIDKAMKLGNVPTSSGVGNFNNIKQYNNQLKETERILRSKVQGGKDGIFSSAQMRDAQGNLLMFTATLKTADGVVEQIRYKWNSKKKMFTPIDRQTLDASEAQLRRVKVAIAELTAQRDRDMLSTKNKARGSEYDKLINDVKTFKVTLDQATQAQKRLNQAMKEEQYSKNLKSVGTPQQHSMLKNADLATVQRFIEVEKRLGVQSLTTAGTIERQGQQVDVLRVKMMGAGKQVQTYTMHFNRATGALHQFGQASTEINANRNLGIFEQLGIAMKRVPVWMAAMTAFYGTIGSVRAMGREILLVDKSLTELKRVASGNINIETIFKGSVGLSKELGNNIHEIMGAVSDLSRTYGQFNERQLLAVARTATLMSNVSDLGVEDATQTLVGTMNAFNIEAEESIRIVDSLNEVKVYQPPFAVM